MKEEGIHYLLEDRIYKLKGLGLVDGSMDITMGQAHRTRKRL